jgi:hypothetical protein
LSDINYHFGFPLEPIDRNGNKVRVGDKIKITEIPDWLVKDLPENEAIAIRKCVGTEMLVFEIDAYCYLWNKLIGQDNEDEYQAQSFALEPTNVFRLSGLLL